MDCAGRAEAAPALWLVYADAPYLMRCCPSVATDPVYYFFSIYSRP
jgi:hypothetical protein